MKKKILMIDDDERICMTVKRCIEKSGDYEVISFTDSRRGLRYAKTDAADIIILDVMMPGMDGVEVLRRLRKEKKTRFIPVIMMTGDTSDETREMAMYEYAEHYVTKPVDLDQLKERIDRMLAIRSQLQMDGFV